MLYSISLFSTLFTQNVAIKLLLLHSRNKQKIDARLKPEAVTKSRTTDGNNIHLKIG
jgi:hypothetical protein